MSLLDTPLALLDRILARNAARVQPDDPVARMIERASARLRPDARYRRRLRSHVVNQYVAVREGLAPPVPRRREMGVIGRAVLLSSLALAVSVTAVGAASGSALPGDALYPVKRQLEQIRIDIAPAWVRPTLMAMALDERLSEVETLARIGRWSQIAPTVADVEAAEAALVSTGASLPASQIAELSRHTAILTALLATAPDASRNGLEHALVASSRALDAADKAAGASQTAPGHTGTAGAGSTGSGNGNAGQSPAATPTPTPTKSPKVTASARPTPTPQPTHPLQTAPGVSSSPATETQNSQ